VFEPPPPSVGHCAVVLLRPHPVGRHCTKKQLYVRITSCYQNRYTTTSFIRDALPDMYYYRHIQTDGHQCASSHLSPSCSHLPHHYRTVSHTSHLKLKNLVAMLCKAQVCGSLVAGTAFSYPAGGMDFGLLYLCRAIRGSSEE
jgi:hypothetical protein